MIMCPHCGRKFEDSDTAFGRLVPRHIDACPIVSLVLESRLNEEHITYCPGSHQNPRNPESDKRPLWKNGGVK